MTRAKLFNPKIEQYAEINVQNGYHVIIQGKNHFFTKWRNTKRFLIAKGFIHLTGKNGLKYNIETGESV